MKSILRYTFLIAAIAIFHSACQQKEQKEGSRENDRSSQTESTVKTGFTVAYDSLQNNWQRMTESDEKKMASIKRLLDEISYTPRFNAIRQRQLVSLHRQVMEKRFDMQTMSASEKIDLYDAAQDSLVNSTLNLAAETPEAEKYPLINELSTDIQAEHNKTIMFRIRHDEFAREVNKQLQVNGDKIKNWGQPYASVTKIPLFSLSGT